MNINTNIGNSELEEIERLEVEKIPFPFQYLEQYLCGELIWDAAIDNTMDEVYRLIEGYVNNYEEND